MNYYPFHIGDFRSGTVNMSRQSRWIYRDMLDVYYDTEKPLSLDFDVLCDQLGAESDEERRIVERLLKFKFDKTEDGYRHVICEQVIAEYRSKAETAKANGSKGGRKPKQKEPKEEPKETQPEPSGFQSGSDQDATGQANQTGSQTNQEPRTNNQIKAPQTPQAGPAGKREGNAIALQTFIAGCNAKGERPVRDYKPLWDYVKGAGMPPDYVALAWAEFCRRFMPGGPKDGKRQKDWRKAFRNYVENNYFKLWAIDRDGAYFLTSQGKQAEKYQEAKAQYESERASNPA